jgi:hypothetical protein
MDQSNTIEFTTTAGHKVVLASFITGRQKRYINDAFLEGVEISSGTDKPQFSVSGEKANVATDRAIESVVVSVDGQTENKVDLVLNLPAQDSDEILAKINEVTSEKKSAVTTPKTS